MRRLAVPINDAKLKNLDVHLSAFLNRRFVDGNILAFNRELEIITRSEILEEEKRRNLSIQEEMQNNFLEGETKPPASPTHSVQPDPLVFQSPQRVTSEERRQIEQMV